MRVWLRQLPAGVAKQADHRMDPITKRRTRSGTAYIDSGDGEDVVVLVHGSFLSSLSWERYISELSANNLRTIALDLAGHGDTPGDLATVTMDTYRDNVADVVSEIDVANPLLVGHSMSGLVVLMNVRDGLSSRAVAIDPSPSLEVQGVGSIEGVPDVYDVFDAGMPTDSDKIAAALPDIGQDALADLEAMVGPESGNARRQRKLGVSVPKEALANAQVAFVGGSLGTSLPFGISAESTQTMADFYNKRATIIDGATHPGIIAGNHADEVIRTITEFAKK